VTSGIPQGTVMAPLLFLHNNNDLLKTAKLCAVLYFCIGLTPQSLQQDLDVLSEWAHKWLMVFDPRKCEYLATGFLE